MQNFKAVIIDFGIAKSFESILVCDGYRQSTWIFSRYNCRTVKRQSWKYSETTDTNVAQINKKALKSIRDFFFFQIILFLLQKKELIGVNCYNWIQMRFVRKNTFTMEVRGKKILYLECIKIKLWNAQTYITETRLVIKNWNDKKSRTTTLLAWYGNWVIRYILLQINFLIPV